MRKLTAIDFFDVLTQEQRDALLSWGDREGVPLRLAYEAEFDEGVVVVAGFDEPIRIDEETDEVVTTETCWSSRTPPPIDILRLLM